jgi:hypothetical protein
LILNQPFSVNDKASGLEIVKYIKQIKKMTSNDLVRK